MASSSLSNRVMNMKFMQKAEDIKINEQRSEEQKKIKDLSEWVLPQSEKLLKLASLKPKINIIGYGEIMSNRNYTTRKSFGPKLEVEEIDSEPISNQSELSSSTDLNSLWRKRKLDNSNDTLKKKRIL